MGEGEGRGARAGILACMRVCAHGFVCEHSSLCACLCEDASVCTCVYVRVSVCAGMYV